MSFKLNKSIFRKAEKSELDELIIANIRFLRILYTSVANGGFGPAYGITGASGGYYFGEDGHYQTMAREPLPETFTGTILEEEIFPFNLSEYERQHNDPPKIDLPAHTWPDHFLSICYLGCGMDAYLDGGSGRIYRGESGYSQTEGITFSLTRLGESLESWLESWMDGKAHL
jgi:hypothetical protein